MDAADGRKMVCNLNSDLGSCEKVTVDVPVGTGQITACSYRVTKAGANMATLCLARELNDKVGACAGTGCVRAHVLGT